ncbi:hypothetical protein ACJJTC_014202 [Scirpophaga incertulas]
MEREKINRTDKKICIPGLRLSKANKDVISGPGTYELQGYIYANLSGILKREEDQKTKITVVSVESLRTPSLLPKTGDIVTAKEDIKSTDKDRIEPYKCFRPGDIILARVLPMTDAHWCLLSTAENELGVVTATAEGSPDGVNMVPVSWSEMQCPKTLVKEPRKVARIIPERLNKKTDDNAEKK